MRMRIDMRLSNFHSSFFSSSLRASGPPKSASSPPASASHLGASLSSGSSDVSFRSGMLGSMGRGKAVLRDMAVSLTGQAARGASVERRRVALIVLESRWASFKQSISLFGHGR